MDEESDVGLAKASILKCLKEFLPEDMRAVSGVRDLVQQCATEFIQIIATQASDICENEAKKTISPDHVLSALKELGFENYLEKVSDELGKCKDLAHRRESLKKANKAKTKNMTEDEMIAEQERLINQAKLKVWGESAEDA